jgi:aminopeptidase C
MRRRAKRIREGQAWERKKEGKPVFFGAHVKRTSFRKTGLVVKSTKKATGRSSYNTVRQST